MEEKEIASWWQLITPHEDIANWDAATHPFFADLGDVLNDKKGTNHFFTNPRSFFERSYLTTGLKQLIKTTLSRLLGEGGSPVLLMQARFGGGKTHALLTIYHVVSAPDIALNFLKTLEGTESIVTLLKGIMTSNSRPKIVTFTGTHVDPLHDKTPWGEIADQLGEHDHVKEHDVQKISPGKKRLRTLLEKHQPLVILMDELMEYVAKVMTGKQVDKMDVTQLLVFLQELSEVVATLPRTVLVITMPEQDIELYSEELMNFAEKIKQVLGRLEIVHVPMTDREIPMVINAQLFSRHAVEEKAKSVIKTFQLKHEQLKDILSLPRLQPEYYERMKLSYPFHPTLLDILLENWGSIPTFQGIRGILRVLSLVINDLWMNKPFCPMIMPGDVNLTNKRIQDELLKHLSPEWKEVLRTEILDLNSRAAIVDQSLEKPIKDLHLARRMATSIFLSSVGQPPAKQGKTLAQIMLMNVTPIKETLLLDSIFEKLKSHSWYLHQEKHKYFYSTKPNLNYHVKLREENIDPEVITNEINSFIIKMIKKKPKTHVWPKNPSDIPDKSEVQVIILPLTHPHGMEATKLFVKRLQEVTGKQGIRIRKNMLVFVAAEDRHILTLQHIVRRFLALKQELAAHYNVKNSSELNELNKELLDLKNTIPYKILMTYRFVGISCTEGTCWMEMDLPRTTETITLTERVVSFLKEQQVIVDKLTPLYLLNRVFGESDTEKSIQEMWNLFSCTPGFPILESVSVLTESIMQGISQGLFRIKNTQSSSKNDVLSQLTLDTVIIKQEHDLLSKNVAKLLKDGDKNQQDNKNNMKEETIHSLMLHAETTNPEITWHDFYRGVILPLLKNKENSNIKVEISLKWESTKGITRNILENQIKESLSQLPLKIKRFDHSTE